MAEHEGRVIVLAIDRLQRGVITRAEAAAELLTYGLGTERVRAALADHDRRCTATAAALVLVAADTLTAACESATSTEQDRTDAHHKLFTAVRELRTARDKAANPPDARTEWLSAFPTPAALEAAVNAYRLRRQETQP